jgi:hypothetical protein
MADVKNAPKIYGKDKCPKGRAIEEHEPAKGARGKVHHEECAPWPKKNQSYLS